MNSGLREYWHRLPRVKTAKGFWGDLQGGERKVNMEKVMGFS